MFNLELIKHKSKLKLDLAKCFASLIDELGNVPLTMQTDPVINGAIVSVCNNYLESQNISKKLSKALVIDSVFEEIYRLESIAVQTRVDQWLENNETLYIQGCQYIKQQSDHDLNLQWLADYSRQNFKQATGLML
jgi:hypothetical protein